MRVFERPDVTLAYDDSDQADLPVLVFFHGLSQSRETWARFLPELAGRLRVLRLDQRGHGESSHAPGTYVLGSYVADTIAFLDDVVAQPAFLVGHSLGGVIAYQIASTRPELVSGVLLEDPPLYVAERFDTERNGPIATAFPLMQQFARDMQDRGAPLEDYISTLEMIPAMNGAGSLADAFGPEGTHATAEALMRLDPEVITPALDGSAIDGADLDNPLSCPAVVVRADPALGAAFSAEDEERFLALNPSSRVVLFEGASHAIHDEQPQRFLDELLALTASVPA